MSIDINKYINNIYMDMPIEYKGLKIYPVLMKDFTMFYESVPVLQVDKDSQGPELSAISYLEFIATMIYLEERDGDRGDVYTKSIKNIFNMVTGFDVKLKFKYTEEFNRWTLTIEYMCEDAEPLVFNKDDFDDIISIILYQNLPEHDEEYMDPILKKALQEEEEMRARKSTQVSLEDRIVAIMVSTGILPEDIYKMTLRKFNLCYLKSVARLDYQICLGASMSGNVTFKEPIENWIPFKKGLDVDKREGQYNKLKDTIQGAN